MAFLKGLWDLQAALAPDMAEYVVPEAETARDALVTGQPLFLVSAPVVSADALRGAVAFIVTYILEASVLEEAEQAALMQANLPAAITDHMVESVVRDFDGFVGAVSAALPSTAENPAPSSATVTFVLHSAIVPFLTGPSRLALGTLSKLELSIWDSGNCPVCGTAASMGLMGESTALDGSPRTLWCAHCHAEWSYARMRCVRCGSPAQDKLRYTYEESDPSHRLHLCDECHGYIKVTFVNETQKPISMVVEEAASVTLDAIAAANGYSVRGTSI